MTTPHTPGPWRIGTAPPNGEQAIGTIRGMMVAVATTGVGMEKETLANARLIAAAPDLLDALRMWLDIHDTPAGFAGKYGKAFDDALAAQQLKVDAAASAARAAIAKAVREAKE